ncbi:MAG TPA: diguanylate cyclase [Burkholderiales bacterium]|nr:diguanylate cyclase [Burkholderiales bacterium]
MRPRTFPSQIARPEWWRLAAVASVVGVTAWSSLVLTREADNVASIWLSDGVLLGILLRTRPRYWAAYLAAGYLGNFAADHWFGDSAMLALGFSVCNMSGVALAAVSLRMRLTDASDLTQRRVLANFLFYGVALAPALSALGGAALSHFFLGIPFLRVFRTWYLAVAIGIALVTPLVLSVRRRELAALFGRAAVARTLGILTLTTGVTTVVFAQSAYPLLFALFPVMMLAIFKLDFTGTAIAIFIAAIIAIVFTIEDYGPMMTITGLTDAQRILFLQITIATAVLVTLPVSLVLAERERLRAALEEANSVLRSLAMTDGLTGLANRRRFDEMLDREWRRTARESGVLSLLLIDVDHFKPYNDYYGHRAGDECLRAVAQALARAARRSGDVCARYGGEEFAVILPNTEAAKAAHIAEQMRAVIEALDIEHSKVADGRLTVSVGVASVRPRDAAGAHPASLIDSADRALYEAKKGGRNRVAAA